MRMDLALVVGENPPPGTRQWTLGPFYTPQTAALKVTDNAAGSPQPVMLTATVINPVASFSASRVSFGTEKINSGTARKSVTLTSIGGTARLTFEKHKWNLHPFARNAAAAGAVCEFRAPHRQPCVS